MTATERAAMHLGTGLLLPFTLLFVGVSAVLFASYAWCDVAVLFDLPGAGECVGCCGGYVDYAGTVWLIPLPYGVPVAFALWFALRLNGSSGMTAIVGQLALLALCAMSFLAANLLRYGWAAL